MQKSYIKTNALCYSTVKATLHVSLASLSQNEKPDQNISILLLFFLFSFLIMHNLKTLELTHTFYLSNECSTGADPGFCEGGCTGACKTRHC